MENFEDKENVPQEKILGVGLSPRFKRSPLRQPNSSPAYLTEVKSRRSLKAMLNVPDNQVVPAEDATEPSPETPVEQESKEKHATKVRTEATDFAVEIAEEVPASSTFESRGVTALEAGKLTVERQLEDTDVSEYESADDVSVTSPLTSPLSTRKNPVPPSVPSSTSDEFFSVDRSSEARNQGPSGEDTAPPSSVTTPHRLPAPQANQLDVSDDVFIVDTVTHQTVCLDESAAFPDFPGSQAGFWEGELFGAGIPVSTPKHSLLDTSHLTDFVQEAGAGHGPRRSSLFKVDGSPLVALSPVPQLKRPLFIQEEEEAELVGQEAPASNLLNITGPVEKCNRTAPVIDTPEHRPLNATFEAPQQTNTTYDAAAPGANATFDSPTSSGSGDATCAVTTLQAVSEEQDPGQKGPGLPALNTTFEAATEVAAQPQPAPLLNTTFEATAPVALERVDEPPPKVAAQPQPAPLLNATFEATDPVALEHVDEESINSPALNTTFETAPAEFSLRVGEDSYAFEGQGFVSAQSFGVFTGNNTDFGDLTQNLSLPVTEKPVCGTGTPVNLQEVTAAEVEAEQEVGLDAELVTESLASADVTVTVASTAETDDVAVTSAKADVLVVTEPTDVATEGKGNTVVIPVQPETVTDVIVTAPCDRTVDSVVQDTATPVEKVVQGLSETASGVKEAEIVSVDADIVLSEVQASKGVTEQNAAIPEAVAPPAESTSDNVPIFEPTSDNALNAEPDSAPTTGSVIDNVLVADPAIDNVLAAKPAASDAPAAELANDIALIAEPAKDNVLTAEPASDNVPTAEPVIDNVVSAETVTDNIPQVNNEDIVCNGEETVVGNATETPGPADPVSENGADTITRGPISDNAPEAETLNISNDKGVSNGETPIDDNAKVAAVQESSETYGNVDDIPLKPLSAVPADLDDLPIPKKGYDLSWLDSLDDAEHAVPTFGSQSEIKPPVKSVKARPKLVKKVVSKPEERISETPRSNSDKPFVDTEQVQDTAKPLEIPVEKPVENSPVEPIVAPDEPEKKAPVKKQIRKPPSRFVRPKPVPKTTEEVEILLPKSHNPQEDASVDDLPLPKKGYDLSFLDKLGDLEHASPNSVKPASELPAPENQAKPGAVTRKPENQVEERPVSSETEALQDIRVKVSETKNPPVQESLKVKAEAKCKQRGVVEEGLGSVGSNVYESGKDILVLEDLTDKQKLDRIVAQQEESLAPSEEELLAQEAASVCEEIFNLSRHLEDDEMPEDSDNRNKDSNVNINLTQSPQKRPEVDNRTFKMPSSRAPQRKSVIPSERDEVFSEPFKSSSKMGDEAEIACSITNGDVRKLQEVTAHEQFVPGSTDLFNDPSALDFLSEKGGRKRTIAANSLYTKFDPIISESLRDAPDGTENPSQPTASLVMFSPTKEGPMVQTASPIIPRENANTAETPGGYIPEQKHREMIILMEKKHREALRTVELTHQDRLLKAQRELQECQKELEIQRHKVAKAQETESQVQVIINEYESVIAELTSKAETIRTESQHQMDRLKEELDMANADLRKTERAFNDMMQKYERTKAAMEDLQTNELVLKNAVEQYNKQIELEKQKAKVLKESLTEKNEKTINNHKKEVETFNFEIARLNALLKRETMKTSQLESANEMLKNNNEELTAICDGLVAQMGHP